VLISYGKGMPSPASAMQQQSHKLQQQQEVSAVLKQLNGRHLARLLKALARLQPPAHSHHSLSAAATSPGSVSSSSSKLPSTAAARWSRQDQQSFWSFTQLAVSECLEQLPSLSAWELSSTLWASCKLAHAPPAFQLRRLLQQLTEPSILAAASAQDLSMALYAIASLAVQVPEQQLEVLLTASAGCLQEAAPQALSNTLWAVATLQHRPSEGWLRQLEAHCTSILDSSQQQQRQELQEPTGPVQAQHIQQYWQQQQRQRQHQPWSSTGFSPLGLYHLLWAMAKLQWQPAPAFQAGFWPASLSQLQHMSPHGTSGILWAAASLALQPPGPWATAWLSRLQQQMQQGRCGPQDLANALWAVVRLGLRPDPAWLDDALRATQAVLASAGTQVRQRALMEACYCMTSLYVLHLCSHGQRVELGQALYSEEGSAVLYSAHVLTCAGLGMGCSSVLLGWTFCVATGAVQHPLVVCEAGCAAGRQLDAGLAAGHAAPYEQVRPQTLCGFSFGGKFRSCQPRGTRKESCKVRAQHLMFYTMSVMWEGVSEEREGP